MYLLHADSVRATPAQAFLAINERNRFLATTAFLPGQTADANKLA
jgi:hypothetical protein